MRDPVLERWTPWDTAPGPGAGPGALRVYCLPHAGGSAAGYLPWADRARGYGLDLVPVELPGHGTRRGEPLPGTMKELVDGVLAVLASRPADEAFLLYGHSMGAQVAYETARRLDFGMRPMPRGLVVSGSRPPGRPDSARLRSGSDRDLLGQLAHLGGTPAALLRHKHAARLILPVLRADLDLLAAFSGLALAEALPCPVTALGGAADDLAGPEWISAWESLTSDRFRHRILPGGHFFPYTDPDAVLAAIASHRGPRDREEVSMRAPEPPRPRS
jgi:medium-chain acyl-[acyl-carrier-protein] hydrolase